MFKKLQDGWRKTIDVVADVVAPSQVRLTRFSQAWATLYDNLDVTTDTEDLSRAELKALIRTKAQLCCHAINEILELLEAEDTEMKSTSSPEGELAYGPCIERVLAEKKLDKLYLAAARDVPTGLMGLVLEFTVYLMDYGQASLFTLTGFIVPLMDFIEATVRRMADPLSVDCPLSSRNRGLFVNLIDRLTAEIAAQPAIAPSFLRDGVPLPLRLAADILDRDEASLHEAALLRKVITLHARHGGWSQAEWDRTNAATVLTRGLWRALLTLPYDMPNAFELTHTWGRVGLPDVKSTLQLKELVKKVRTMNHVLAEPAPLAGEVLAELDVMLRAQLVPHIVEDDGPAEAARLTRNLRLLIEEMVAPTALVAIVTALLGMARGRDGETAALTDLQAGDEAQGGREWPPAAAVLFGRLVDSTSPTLQVETIELFNTLLSLTIDDAVNTLTPAPRRAVPAPWSALIIAREVDWAVLQTVLATDAEVTLEQRVSTLGTEAVVEALRDAAPPAPEAGAEGRFLLQVCRIAAAWPANSARVNLALSALLANMMLRPGLTFTVDSPAAGDRASVYGALGLGKVACQAALPTDWGEQQAVLADALDRVKAGNFDRDAADPVVNSVLLDLCVVELDTLSKLVAEKLAV